MSFKPDKESFSVSQELNQAELTDVAISYYSPNADEEVIIAPGDIVIENHAVLPRWFTMWVDNDGAGVANGNLRAFEKDVGKNDYWTNTFYVRMNNSAGNLSIQAEANSSLTVTIQGVVIDVSN